MNNYSLLILLLIFQACVGHNEPAFSGTYSGTLPCADCPGIDYQLTLSNDHYYSEKMTYQDRNVPTVLDSGTYSIKNDTILQLKNKPESVGMRQFAIHDNQLSLLDMDGKAIQSNFADRYILKKIDKNTFIRQTGTAQKLNSKWKLQSINGNKLDEGIKAPWIEIKLEDNHFFGFGGCNSLNGEVELTGDSLKFGRIISTKMACLNHNIENEFLWIFRNQSWAFQIADSTLKLTNQKNRLVFKKEE